MIESIVQTMLYIIEWFNIIKEGIIDRLPHIRISDLMPAIIIPFYEELYIPIMTAFGINAIVANFLLVILIFFSVTAILKRIFNKLSL